MQKSILVFDPLEVTIAIKKLLVEILLIGKA
jgi:hypothetical protein